jgi:hypothetical protein
MKHSDESGGLMLSTALAMTNGNATTIPVPLIVASILVAPISGLVGTVVGLRFNRSIEDRRRRDEEAKRQMDKAAEQYRWARDQRRSTYNALLNSAYDLLRTSLKASVNFRIRRFRQEWAEEESRKMEDLFKSLVRASTSVQLFGSPEAAELAIKVRQTGRQVTAFMDRQVDSAQESLSELLDIFIAQCQTDLGIEALGVVTREVIDAADRWSAAEGGVGPVMVVSMDPGLQGTVAGGV